MQIIINSKPVPKGRPRFARGHTFTDKKTKDFEKLVPKEAKKAMDKDKPFTLPLKIEISFIFALPKCYLDTKLKRDNAHLNGYIYENIPMTNKPDIDNLAKSVLDGLNGIVYEDDKQVVGLSLYKMYGKENTIIIDIDELHLR